MPTLRHFYWVNFFQNLLVVFSSFILKCFWDFLKVAGQEDVCLSSSISIWPNIQLWNLDSSHKTEPFFVNFPLNSRSFCEGKYWFWFLCFFVRCYYQVALSSDFTCLCLIFCFSLSLFWSRAQSYFDPAASCHHLTKKGALSDKKYLCLWTKNICVHISPSSFL